MVIHYLTHHACNQEVEGSILAVALRHNSGNLFTHLGRVPACHSGVRHSLQCMWPVWPRGSGGLGSTPGSSSLLVHAGRLSEYSETNISGRHRAVSS